MERARVAIIAALFVVVSISGAVAAAVTTGASGMGSRQAGAGIASTAIVAGRSATITGIVKRPYSTATDRRFAVLPRASGDLSLAAAASGTSGGVTTGGGSAGGGTSGGPADQQSADVTPDTDLAVLGEHVGAHLRVGGLVASLQTDGFDLDDGTATAHLVLHADALALLPYLRTGDALAATGQVEELDSALIVVIAGAADLVRVDDLGQVLPAAMASTAPTGGDLGPDARLATAGGIGSGIGSGPESVSLFAMAGLSLVSLIATVLRRRRARQRLRALIVARLVTLKPIGAERESA